jgi:hypothetical protein
VVSGRRNTAGRRWQLWRHEFWTGRRCPSATASRRCARARVSGHRPAGIGDAVATRRAGAYRLVPPQWRSGRPPLAVVSGPECADVVTVRAWAAAPLLGTCGSEPQWPDARASTTSDHRQVPGEWPAALRVAHQVKPQCRASSGVGQCPSQCSSGRGDESGVTPVIPCETPHGPPGPRTPGVWSS